MDNDVALFEALAPTRQALLDSIGKVVVGQQHVVDLMLTAMFANGHCLFVGVPGLAKTLLVNTVAHAVGVEHGRIQFTPDLMPSDITGSEILEEDKASGNRRLRFVKGPIFSNLLLADEINRTPPKTQAALLQAMQEMRVTAAGNDYELEPPFLVFATQNPIEQSGTFELPEAQLDRFMLCHRLHYPDVDEEEQILKRNLNLGIQKEGQGAVANTEFDIVPDEPVGEAEDLNNAIDATHQVHVSEVFVKHVVELVGRTRNHPNIELGGSPRAGIALIKGARARALIHGRNYAIPDDLFALAEDVLLHRIRLNYEALAEGLTGADILDEILREMG